MKPKLILGLTLVLSGGLLAGCQTETIQKSHMEAVNLRGDHRSETIQMQHTGGGWLKNGAPFESLSLGEPCLLVIFYPTKVLNQMLRTETGSHQVNVWLVRNQSTGWEAGQHLQDAIRSTESPGNLSIPNSEQLHGQVEIKYADWRHKNHFHLGINLAGEDGATLKGEFDSYDETKFDPNQLWMGPFMIFFSPFVGAKL